MSYAVSTVIARKGTRIPSVSSCMSVAGHLALGCAAAGLGTISLAYADFAITWQPVPDWVPTRTLLAYLSGFLLIGAGAAIVSLRGARAGAAVLSVFLLSWIVLLHPLRYLAGAEAFWLATAECLAVAAAAWIASGWRAQVARYVFGACTPIFGLAHFLYIDFTATMVPAWIPAPELWAWFTGAGHVAAGVSILTGVFARAGATLLAIMCTSFVVLVHIPRVLASPGARLEWHLLCTATLIAGSAWIVASYLFAESERRAAANS